jgi:hypothetical protein
MGRSPRDWLGSPSIECFFCFPLKVERRFKADASCDGENKMYPPSKNER